jgi:hypothetical protein
LKNKETKLANVGYREKNHIAKTSFNLGRQLERDIPRLPIQVRIAVSKRNTSLNIFVSLQLAGIPNEENCHDNDHGNRIKDV